MIVWKTRIFSKDGSYNGYLGDAWLVGEDRRPATVDEVRESIRGWIEKYIVSRFDLKDKDKLLQWALEDIEKEPFENSGIFNPIEEDGTPKKFMLGYANH